MISQLTCHRLVYFSLQSFLFVGPAIQVEGLPEEPYIGYGVMKQHPPIPYYSGIIDYNSDIDEPEFLAEIHSDTLWPVVLYFEELNMLPLQIENIVVSLSLY